MISKQLYFGFDDRNNNLLNFIDEINDYNPPDWDEWFMQGVYWVASKSKDPKTKIGALLVKNKRIISTGYNGIPIGVDESFKNRHQRPEKYKWYEHAERNAIYSAAKHGIITDGSTLYTNALPCADCARGVIQAGIHCIMIHKQFNDLCDYHEREHWKDHGNVTLRMLFEHGVEISSLDKELNCKAYFDGKIYNV